jgi:CubicO group peptidase (beta-lactamase class C family)
VGQLTRRAAFAQYGSRTALRSSLPLRLWGSSALSYHDLWWIPNDPYDSYMASGIHGQRLFVSRLDLVAVHFGSQVISPEVRVAPLVQAFLRIGIHLAATR